MNTESPFQWEFRKASPISTLWTVQSKAPLVRLDSLRWVGSQIQGCNQQLRGVICMIDVGWNLDLCAFWTWHFLGMFPFHLVTTPQQAQFGMFSIFSEDRIFKFNAESANNHECSPSDASSLAKGAHVRSVRRWRRRNFRIFCPFFFVGNGRIAWPHIRWSGGRFQVEEYWCHADSGWFRLLLPSRLAGVFSVAAVGFGICFLFYCVAHCTYPKDRRRVWSQKEVDVN